MPQKDYNSIIICQEQYEVPGGIKVITYKDTGGMSFERERRVWSAKTESDYYCDRMIQGKNVATLEELQSLVHMAVLHADITTDSASCFRVLLNRGFSTHFMIDWNGTIYQTADVLTAAWHAGTANNISVGIDLNNLLPNILTEEVEEYPPAYQLADETGIRQISEEMIINGARYKSYGYTDAQYISLIALLKTLIKVLPNIKPFPPFDETNKIINSMLDQPDFAGFVAHWHLNPEKWDPGPGFDWQRVYHGLSREHNSFPVELLEGKNISTILIPEKVKEAASQLCENNEKSFGGGYYPLGINQNWHGGIHIHVKRSTPILAMMDGVLVAAHFGESTSLGNNNFVLLRHDIQLPKEKTLKIYSLYMHLAPISMEPDDSSPPWLKMAYKIYSGTEEDEKEELRKRKKDKFFNDKLSKNKGGKDKKEKFSPQDNYDDYSYLEDDEERRLPYLDVGDHLAALKRGQVALFSYKEKDRISVSAGELIGYAGQFGEEDERSDLVHLELFTDESWKNVIDIGVHGEYFIEMEEDMNNDLMVETDDILKLFYIPEWKKKKAKLKLFHRLLDPSEIEDFYSSVYPADEEAKNIIRRAVTRHISEWSDQVDWFNTLVKAEDWTETVQELKEIFGDKNGIFRKKITNFLPFIWLNKTVAQHIGIKQKPYTGIFYYFHPINFLIWLTFHSSQRLQVISQGKSKKELVKERKKLQERIEKQRALKRFDINSEDDHEGMYFSLEEIRSESKGFIFDNIIDIPGDGEWK